MHASTPCGTPSSCSDNSQKGSARPTCAIMWRPAQAGSRYCQCTDQCVDQASPTRRLKLDTFSPTVPTQAGLENTLIHVPHITAEHKSREVRRAQTVQ